jgi:hypothetical protein
MSNFRNLVLSFIICSALLQFSTGICEQNDSGNIIIPGKGIGQLHVGDSSARVIKVMGQYFRKTGYSEEKKNWEEFGYNTDIGLVFNIGFDYFLEYNPENNKTEYPAWKIYFKNDRVVYITLSSFIYNDEKMKKTGIPPECYFWGNKDNMVASLGNDFFEYTDSQDNKNFYYLEKGVVVIITDSEIRTITLFTPLTYNQKMNFINKCKSAEAKL